ncbi:erythromycin esterase family protein [Tenacibaculum finnmarkense]|uniref:erythromycin esterase family protein n=1 Tax=Tenacibaculum finnmarkense TaxID=2781243 RepID=UPI001E5EA2BA|nr:erythromycin esterase family protein [Tenacibaculum finnmarkense]MCD8413682.1 erythromycin esterase family protein [Tenacibaculum finnmarkense genomovar ulcerans]
MNNITVITFLLISNLIFSQNTQSACQPMFNSNLFSFEGEELEDTDPYLVFRNDKNYQINFDSLEFIDGNRSVSIKGLSQTTSTHAKISIYIPIKIKKKSKIELSVWVKTDSIHGENAGTILQLLGYGNNRSALPTVFKFSDGVLKGSRDWTKISLSTILKEDEPLIALNILMQGKGKAWFDNLELKINGEKINDILFFKDTEEEIQMKEALKKYVHPLNIKNLKPISDFISTQKNNIRIIGLGEATHGTKEVYEYKAEIIKSLIKNNGVRKIALEARYANVKNLNTYVLSGKGNLKKVISEIGFWLYNTVEFKDLLIWLKEYNKKTNDKVSIIGIDSQPRGISLKRLTKKLKEKAFYSKLLGKLNNDSTKVAKKITISNALFQKLLKSNQSIDILMNARELSQSYFLEQYVGSLKYNRFRDSLMALNIKHLEKKLPSNEKIIYWAHDKHIQKKSGWAGDFLNKKFKDSYVNVGFLLGKGKYNAINIESRKLNSDNYLTSVNCNSLENFMRTYNDRDLILNYNSASKNPYLKNNLFNKYVVKRSIGAGATNYQFSNLSNNKENSFDLLIYIENSNPSQFLKKD